MWTSTGLFRSEFSNCLFVISRFEVILEHIRSLNHTPYRLWGLEWYVIEFGSAITFSFFKLTGVYFWTKWIQLSKFWWTWNVLWTGCMEQVQRGGTIVTRSIDLLPKFHFNYMIIVMPTNHSVFFGRQLQWETKCNTILWICNLYMLWPFGQVMGRGGWHFSQV